MKSLSSAPRDEPLAQLLREMRSASGLFSLPLEVDSQRALLQRAELVRCEMAELHHLPEHDVAAIQRAFRIGHRLVVAVPLQHADQRSALERVEFARRFIEVGARRHLDAIRVVEKRHRVEIGFEDLVLRIDSFDLERGNRFLQLAGELFERPISSGKRLRASFCVMVDPPCLSPLNVCNAADAVRLKSTP